MELGGDIEVSAENERLGARSRYEQLHVVVPGAPAIEAAFSAAVGHVNTEELKHKVRESRGGCVWKDLKTVEFARYNTALQDVADEFYGTTSTFPREAQPPDGARPHAFSYPTSIATGWAKRIQ